MSDKTIGKDLAEQWRIERAQLVRILDNQKQLKALGHQGPVWDHLPRTIETIEQAIKALDEGIAAAEKQE